MEKRIYFTNEVCASQIEFVIEDGIVTNVEFSGGCEGNVHAISKLVEGMKMDEIIKRLKGIDCDGKGTSCPDQLARALEEFKSA